MASIYYGDETDDDVTASNSDELMLKELERRDGIYSFIFHELEAAPTPTLTPPTPTLTPPTPTLTPPTPTLPHHHHHHHHHHHRHHHGIADDDDDDDDIPFMNNCFSLNNQVTVFISEPFIEPGDTLDEDGILNIDDEIFVINRESHIASTTSLSTITSLTFTSAFSTTFTSMSTSTPSSTPLSLTPPSSTLFMDMPKDRNRNFLPSNKPLNPLGGHLLNGKLSNPYTSKFQPNITAPTSTSVLYDYPNMYDCAPGKIRLRAPLPRFSHITTPLVRNRRHPLKELPEYKNAMRYKRNQVPDLRHLFPYDPDVHAPFIKPRSNLKRNIHESL